MTEAGGANGPVSFPTSDGSTTSAARWIGERRLRYRRSQIVFGIWLGLVAVFLVPVALIAPPVLQDRALDRIVQVVALDWRDFGPVRAEQRLRIELLAARLADRAPDCALMDEPREVRCAWVAVVGVPRTRFRAPLDFVSVAPVPDP